MMLYLLKLPETLIKEKITHFLGAFNQTYYQVLRLSQSRTLSDPHSSADIKAQLYQFNLKQFTFHSLQDKVLN